MHETRIHHGGVHKPHHPAEDYLPPPVDIGADGARSLWLRLNGLVSLMRPRQWIKNGFVIAPLIFSGRFLDPTAIRNVIIAALLFCVASAATYIVNDLHDLERDRAHPRKRHTRPLAAGIVSTPMAIVLLILLYAMLAASWFSVPGVVQAITGYLLLNLAYTFALKDQPVLDIFTIAFGFVLRVYAGAVAVGVPLSAWMFATTLSLALYLAAMKRRQELRTNGVSGRKVLEQYSVALVDRYATMAAMSTLVFYSLYVLSERPGLVITIPIVLFGLYRYWYLVESTEAGDSSTEAFGDRQLQLTGVLWLLVCAWLLWPEQAPFAA